jgi:hypothetical protein
MSNLINNDMPPPPDVSQVAAVAADAAKVDPTGDAAFLAQKNLQEAQFRAQEYAARQAYVDKTNEPELARMRAEEEQRTKNLMTGVVAAVGTLGVATLALEATGGVVGAWNRPAAKEGPSLETSEAPPSQIGLKELFRRCAMGTDGLAAALGRAPPGLEQTMMFSAPFMAAGMAGPVADPSAPDPSANDPSESVARVQPRRNTAFMLENNKMALGPQPSSGFKDKYG